MVETVVLDGKKTDRDRPWVLVVAGALQRDDRLWLVHQRALKKHHGGLWEFPGGKAEGAENPKEALVRELAEELGIEVSRDACEPIGFADDVSESAEKPLVILLYKICDWTGEPAALEGEAVRWMTLDAIGALNKPPLDQQLYQQLVRAESMPLHANEG